MGFESSAHLSAPKDRKAFPIEIISPIEISKDAYCLYKQVPAAKYGAPRMNSSVDKATLPACWSFFIIKIPFPQAISNSLLIIVPGAKL